MWSAISTGGFPPDTVFFTAQKNYINADMGANEFLHFYNYSRNHCKKRSLKQLAHT